MNKLLMCLSPTAVILCFSFAQSFAQEETKSIVLKDGTTVTGTIIGQTDSTFVVRTQYGTLDIKRSDIVKQEKTTRSPSNQLGLHLQTIQLKDGTTINGVIREQSADTLEVESSYGTMRIPRSNVRRLSNRVIPIREQQEKPVEYVSNTVEDSYRAWEIIGGLAIPTGEFASTTLSSEEKAGFASIGGCLGVRYHGEAAKGFELGMTEVFGYYPMNQSEYAKNFLNQTRLDVGGWYLFWTIGTIGFGVPLPPTTRFHAGGLLGFMLGVSPSMTATYGSSTADQAATAATAFSYGAYAGIIFNRIDIELRYITAEPEYSLRVTSGSNSLTGKAKQPTATIQLTLGVIVD